jgi:hypothetical protein
MTRTGFVPRTIAVLALALAVTPAAMAKFPLEVFSCRKGITTYSGKLLTRSLRAIQKCNDKALLSPSACTPPAPPATIAALEAKFLGGIAKACATTPDQFLGPGYLDYPGPCSDGTPGDDFTLADLQNCLLTSHEDVISRLIDVEYNSGAPLDDKKRSCQKTIAKSGGKLVTAKLKAIQTCIHNDQTLTAACRTDPTAMTRIAEAESKARADIVGRCTASDVSALGICSDPACAFICATCDPACVAECVIVSHGDTISNLDANVDDLIDFEYPAPSLPTCGDGRRNRWDEECDGSDDVSCPGSCGAAGSAFACLCLGKPRERVVEHADTDLDTGWTGLAHDFSIVEGGGYVVDLYDCDGPTGPDTLCTVGPSCSGVPHPPCSNDAQCASSGLGTCRKELTAVGPHCRFDVQHACTCTSNSATAQLTCADQTNCPGAGNFCIQQFHTPPLPLSAGGVPVCIVNVFTEDVVGTKDLATGSSAIRLRQKSIVQMTGTPSQPCPVCGGFCKAAAGDLGGRHNCVTSADCADTASQICVTDHLCSFGPNQGQGCRPDPPFGGPTPLFGNPSVDCPPTLSSPGVLDIVFDPQTTDTVSLQPSFQCSEPVFGGKACAGGSKQGADCTSASECPGGSCSHQCFCPSVGGVRQQPNGCGAACVGGPFDADACTDDSDCPGGFCHLADCRPDPTAPAAVQPYEGGCTVTVEGQCSVSTYRGCFSDADCASPTCLTCEPNETCQVKPKDCYINSGITRVGVASTTDPVQSAIFCIPATGQSAVDSTAGLPGPGTIRESTTVIDTGF